MPCTCDACQAEIASLRAQLPDGMKHCTILFKECEKGHGRLTATNWVQHECPTCERDELRAELAANNELYAIAQSDLAAVSLQYDAATAVMARLEAAARQDAEAISRLTAALEPFAKLNVTRFMVDGCRYEFRIDAAWIRGARALARRRP